MAGRGEQEAIAKYEEFHRFRPRKIGSFGKGFHIPSVVYRAGKGTWVTYQSDKVDPSTLRLPRRPVDYIHEHGAGVTYYLPVANEHTERGKIAVPERFVEAEALTCLGKNLGYCFINEDGEEIEARSTRPYPELYATPDGKCLLVIQSKKTVTAMAWGGGLGVFARGIDG